MIPPMIRTSSSHTRANTTNIFLVGTKNIPLPFPIQVFLVNRTACCRPVQIFIFPEILGAMHFYRNTLSRAFSVTITLLGAALFPDGLGIVRLSRSALSRAFSVTIILL